MTFPTVQVLAWLATITGIGTLSWYATLEAHEKLHADELAGFYALSLFEKSVRELSKAEAQVVHGRVRAHFG